MPLNLYLLEYFIFVVHNYILTPGNQQTCLITRIFVSIYSFFMVTSDHANLPYFRAVLTTNIKILQPRSISHFIPNVDNSRLLILPNQSTVLLLHVHSWVILKYVSGHILNSMIYFKFWAGVQLPEAKLLMNYLVTQANWRLILV